MMEVVGNVEVNGQSPILIGQHLEALLCEEFWFNGELKEPANVIHLKISGAWWRLYFDCGIIFWRHSKNCDAQNYSYSENDNHFETKISDVGANNNLIGHSLQRVVATAVPFGSKVGFELDNDLNIVFINSKDHTNYEI